MAQLSSRKTLVRAGTVGAGAGATTYLAARAFGDEMAFSRAGVIPAALSAAVVGAGATAFFESQDTN